MLRLLRSNLLWSVPVTLTAGLVGFLVGGLLTTLTGNNYFTVMFEGGSTTGHQQEVFYIVTGMTTGFSGLIGLSSSQLIWFIVHRNKQ